MSATASLAACRADHESDAFYRLFLLCLILISLPVKNFAYVVPPLYLLIRLLSANNRGAVRTLIVVCIVAVASGLSVMVDSLNGRDVNLPGMLLALLTFLPLFLMVGETHDHQLGDRAIQRMRRIVAWYVIIQSVIGFAQFLLSRNPDAVAGTFGLFDYQLDRITINQVYFTCVLFGMILFLLLDIRDRLAKTAIVLGSASCVLAQSGHQTIFFVASLGLVALLQLRWSRVILRTALVLAFMLLAMVALYPKTVTIASAWFQKVVLNENSPKRLVLNAGLQSLSEPKNLALGVGIGQFCSRAALITSGDYISTELPGFATAKSSYFEDGVMPGMIAFASSGEGSAISKPYSSALAVLVELGLPLGLLLLAVLIAAILGNQRLTLSGDGRRVYLGVLANAGLLFIVLCCCVENYAEFPQATFLPFLLYVAVLSNTHADANSA